MRNVRYQFLILLLLAGQHSRAQTPETVQQYIDTYKEIAIQEMQRTGVPASIKLAQGIHETMAGTSDLVLKSNNHFGIKCKDTWRGESVVHDDDLRGECFRKYGSALDSYRDHSDFLKSSPRYASLFNLDPMDYQHWAYGLKKAGYATNPQYPQIIIRLIEDYNLQEYTLIALGKVKEKEEDIAKVQVQEPKTVVNEPIQDAIPLAVVKKEEVVTIQPARKVERSKYPEAEFKLNETRAIYAKKGTSFLAIAEQYSVPLARLFEFNDMKEMENLDEDQLIYLQRKRKTGNNDYHVIQPGESLHDIAQLEAIRLETMLEYNWLRADSRPAIGEKLYLQSKAPSMPSLALKENYTLYSPPATVTKDPENSVKLTVRPKETIYSIASKYHVRIEDIVKWNQLSNKNLKTGQVLKIYK